MDFQLFFIFTLPIIGGILGWFTNYIAIKLLFHPKEEKVILGFFKIQGIFPKRQDEIAVKLSQAVSQELFSTADIKDKLANPEQMDKMSETITRKVALYFAEEFPEKYPLANLMMTQKMKTGILGEIHRKVSTLTPEVITNYVNEVESKIDVEAIVEEKVKNFSSDRLEKLLMGILDKELGFIERIGGVIGFAVGLVQMLLMLWQRGGI